MKVLIIFLTFCLTTSSAFAKEVFGVTKVINGHTFELSDGRTVRLIGVEASSEESTAFVRGLVEGRGVTLDFDVQKEDEEGHVLVYALMIETFVNATILLAGYGTPESVPPNTKYDAFFNKLYEDAVEHKRGLWKN